MICPRGVVSMCHHHHPGVFLHHEQGLSGHRGPLDLQSNEAAPDHRAGGVEATQQAGDEGGGESLGIIQIFLIST